MVRKGNEDPGLRSTVAALVHDYDPYATNRQASDLLRNALGIDVPADQARARISALASTYYQNEAVVKHALVGHILMRGKADEVTFFEFSTKGNRVDLCRVNGHSVAYEIKTAYDTFDRLGSQLAAYAKVFDFVYVVVPCERHEAALAAVSDNVGLITYSSAGGRFSFAYRKRACKLETDCLAQLECLPQKSLQRIAKEAHLEGAVQLPRAQLEPVLVDWGSSHSGRFNALFKHELKRRYRSKWQGLREWYAHVQPLDMQASFASEILLSV